jgi:putative FmdB family regulatory protein
MPIYEYICSACGRHSSILFRSYAGAEESPRCAHCDSAALRRAVSRPGMIRATGAQDTGELRPVDPRRAVETMSRQYDKAGIDPGRGFDEVARRAAAGDSPEALKEVVKEARKNEGAQP